MEPTSPILDVGAALTVRDGKYLIAQRKEGDSFGGCWELPGGKKEPGETLQTCVARELKEELDIDVTVVRFFRVISYVYPQRTVRLNIFLCRLPFGEPTPIECQAVTWAPPGDLHKYNFPDADSELIKELSGIDPESLFAEGKHPVEYLEGIRLFNRGDYFEAHEVWESLWHRQEGEPKLFLQSLIQAAVALRHHQTGNLNGFRGLSQKAFEKWDVLPSPFWDLDVKAFRVGLEGFLKRVNEAGIEGSKNYPFEYRIALS